MPSKNSSKKKKKKGRGGNRGKGRSGGSTSSGRGRVIEDQLKSAPITDQGPAITPAKWEPGGRKMTRRIESDRNLREVAITAVIPKSQVKLPRPLCKDDFIELSRGARLAIISKSDGSSVSKSEMISNEIYCRAVYLASLLVDEVDTVLGEDFSKMLLSDNEDHDFVLSRVNLATYVLQRLDGFHEFLSTEDIKDNLDWILVLAVEVTLGIHGRLMRDYKLLNGYEAAIDHANEAITICAQSATHRLDHTIRQAADDALLVRATCLHRMGEYEEAQRDFRAVCAWGRIDAPQISSDLRKNTHFCLELLSECMESNAQRPFFADRERKLVEKEMGVGMYSKERYRCRGCGLEPSNTAKLHRCSRCRNAWFCSKDCLVTSWSAKECTSTSTCSHKNDCRSEVACLDFTAQAKRIQDEAISTHGYCFEIVSNYGPILVLRDAECEYFSFLSNQAIRYKEPKSEGEGCA